MLPFKRTWSRFALPLATIALLAIFALPAVAQEEDAVAAAGDPAAAAQGETSAAGKDFRESVGMMIVNSGVFGVMFFGVLFVFSVAGLWVIADRLWNLRRPTVAPPAFLAELVALCGRSDCGEGDLRQLAESNASPAARILKAGVMRSGRPVPEVEKSMEDAAARETAALRARNRPLSVIGATAPLVGLLGTVVGMIFAFGTASQVGVGRGDQLAGGIYLALFTTAVGLAIAIPCLLFSAWFNARIERYLRDMDESLVETMPVFARLEERSYALAPRAPQMAEQVAERDGERAPALPR